MYLHISQKSSTFATDFVKITMKEEKFNKK